MTRVFLSYSRKDLEFVERLARDLQAAGLEVWYDLSGLVAGLPWGTEIQKAIRESQYFIAVLSPNSVESQWVEREFLYANNQKLKAIPILYKPCDLPMWCLNLHFIDMQGRGYELHFKDLLKGLGVEERGEKKEAEPPVEAPAVLRQGTPPQRKVRVRPAWIIALVALAAVTAFAIWGVPPLLALAQPATTATPTPTSTATATSTRAATFTTNPSDPLQPLSTGTSTIEPVLTVTPTLDPQFGVVYGTVAWAGEPHEIVTLKLCTEWLYACGGTEYTTIIDEQGNFSFNRIKPGKYYLITQGLEQVTQTRMRDEAGALLTVGVIAGKALNWGAIYACQHDLSLTWSLDGTTARFTWQAYPGANLYVVQGQDVNSGYGFGPEQTSSLSVSANLPAGSYKLDVEAWRPDAHCAETSLLFTVP
jgi:hypothetical protein